MAVTLVVLVLVVQSYSKKMLQYDNSICWLIFDSATQLNVVRRTDKCPTWPEGYGISKAPWAEIYAIALFSLSIPIFRDNDAHLYWNNKCRSSSHNPCVLVRHATSKYSATILPHILPFHTALSLCITVTLLFFTPTNYFCSFYLTIIFWCLRINTLPFLKLSPQTLCYYRLLSSATIEVCFIYYYTSSPKLVLITFL